ncbi:MAG: CRTAC1 family protein [Acidobacteria bacterium]|nr:CRTAC1 family protein [Acidobacteriota bacterium]
MFFPAELPTGAAEQGHSRPGAQGHPQSSARGRKTPATDVISFNDATRAAGINFHLTCGSLEKHYIMETMCGGVAVFDYDNDGWMDIYFVNGSTLEDVKAGKCHSGKLYRNNHDGTFSDVTARSGLNHCGWGYGVAIGDYDNDGWEDLYLTYLDGGVLYHNNRDGTFVDVTAKGGVANAGHWGTSAAFGDYDNDGRLDLYVANYVDLDLDHLPQFGKGPFCQYRGIPVSCGPRGLKGGRDRLYHNNGDGTFTDVTEKLNIDSDSYYGLGVLWLDYDLDGCLDLYVANDSSPSLLYHNNCHGGFDEVGVKAGVAYSSDGREQAGMGVDSADYDRDGWPDIVKTNFSDDSNNLYHNDHDGEFTDLAGAAGFGPISIPFLGFGVKFADFGNRGWPDVFVTNGHVNPQVDSQSFGVSYAERPLLFRNSQDGRFEETGLSAGAALARRYVGRGAATADFGNRGVEDLLMTVLDGSPVLLHNHTIANRHSVLIKVVGTASNRDGFGARVQLKAGGIVQSAEVRANSSFESASDPRLHFGLGTAREVDEITIRWPSGHADLIGSQAVDEELVIQEGLGVRRRIPLLRQ